MRPAEQLCVASSAPFSQMTYELQVTSLGFLTHLVPTVFAHGSEGAADVVVVVEVVEAVDVVPVVVDVVAVPIDVPSL